MPGKLIVIEGLDGSGKTTQTQLLGEVLSGRGVVVRRIKLPNYEDDSSALVKMYLDGRFGNNPQDVNVYAASSFFAVDRFVSYNSYWKDDYLNGAFVLSDRYTTSNVYHQAIKLPEAQWNAYWDWLQDFEYNKIGIPKPNLVVFLDMPVDVSQQLMTERYAGDEVKKDIHEKNCAYLKHCRRAALVACNTLGWHRVDCCDGSRVLSIEEINEKIVSVVCKELSIDA